LAEQVAPPDELARAREAVESCSWEEAVSLLSELDRTTSLEPGDLEGLAEAAWWRGQMDASIDARERAYAAHLAAGNSGRAARLALRVARDHELRRSPTMSEAWVKRAERLLDQAPESPDHGYLERSRSHRALRRGDFDAAAQHAQRAMELGRKFGDRNLIALGLHDEGNALVQQGRLDEGFALLDEATVAAVGGELDPYPTAIIYCGVIASCRDIGDYVRAGDWTDAAKRWCERQSITGFPGQCRIYRAEIMRLRGNWLDAEQEVGLACTELSDFAPDVAAHGFYELGELRLRMGDLEGAEEAFRQAHGLGVDPEPGLALLQLERGEVEAAARSMARTIENTPPVKALSRARLFPAQVEIALAAGDNDTARAAAESLEEIAEEFGTAALRAASATSRGAVELADGDAGAAARTLRRARDLWQEVDVPYEGAKARVLLAEAYAADGDAAAAELELQAAKGVFDRLGATRALARTAALLARSGTSATRRAVRTFVFTDVVSSTNLIEVIGDEAWQDLVGWHDRTLRALFSEYEGAEIDSAGDGFFVAFDSAETALACAIAVQRRLADHRREHGFAPQVRIGVHAAEATASAAGYHGKGVHEAARLGALAGGGEIIASLTTIESAEVGYSNVRTVELKGISEPVEIVTVDWR
jgi:class 3 adenylate cyclase